MLEQKVYVVIISGQYVGVAATEGQAMEIVHACDHKDYIIKEQTINPYN
jgi:hypothetical protein|tara:strand:+ start:594 stop:740 length:147 start_codon:yes stop_codon:yes gene_type:complete